jgi:hypothetical protein
VVGLDPSREVRRQRVLRVVDRRRAHRATLPPGGRPIRRALPRSTYTYRAEFTAVEDQ